MTNEDYNRDMSFMLHQRQDVIDVLKYTGIKYELPVKDKRFIRIYRMDRTSDEDDRNRKTFSRTEYVYYWATGNAKCVESKERHESNGIEDFLEKYIR